MAAAYCDMLSPMRTSGSEGRAVGFGTATCCLKYRIKLEFVMQNVFNKTVELLFYQSKVKCYLFAYKWQPFTWSLTIPIACI